MKLLIKLNHPAHYHLFKNLVRILKSENIDVLIVIKNKDILQDLLDSEGIPYIKIIESVERKFGSKISIIKANLIELIKQDIELYKIVKKEKPDLMFGTDIAIAHVGWLLKIPSYIFNEDDYSVNKLFCSFTYPFCSYIVSPSVCDVGKYSKKKIEYNGYQKLAYLHPYFFSPKKEIVEKYLPLNNKFFLLRLVSFTAGHDIEKKHSGITLELMSKLINTLLKHGDVYITSEKELHPAFIKYKLIIDPKDIHHILAYSDLFISDSQSMTVEAAMLGTSSIRFNTFVGKISVLNELEQKYKLTFGISNEYPELLIKKVEQLLNQENLKKEFIDRRNQMLLDKISLTDFMVSLVK
ncbi:MAG: DUF354 domain-containing protein [Bacteroidetes bacterium]|nr:DUF354 domain-containing protein [Bacteroidota bacterium]